MAVVVAILVAILGGITFVCCWCCSCCWLARRRGQHQQLQQQIIVIPAKTATVPIAAGTPPTSQGYIALPQSDPLPSHVTYPEAPPPYSLHPYSSTYPETGCASDEYSKSPYLPDDARTSYQMSAPPLSDSEPSGNSTATPQTKGTETIQILPEYSKPSAYNST